LAKNHTTPLFEVLPNEAISSGDYNQPRIHLKIKRPARSFEDYISDDAHTSLQDLDYLATESCLQRFNTKEDNTEPLSQISSEGQVKLESPGCSEFSTEKNLDFIMFTKNREYKRRTRHAERTVEEVLELIKKWRAEAEKKRENGKKKISLADAAKEIGVPKKSLDDYMTIIRKAKEMGFDFCANLKKKFGTVRAFVKSGNGALSCVGDETQLNFHNFSLAAGVSDNSKRILKY